MANKIRKKIQEGLPTIGTWMQLPTSSVAEILGNSGYDWVAVDLEHGHFSNAHLPDIFRAIELGGSIPFARVAQTKTKDIKQVLDAGAQGIIFPMIETGEQLRDAISKSFYPPKGVRGIGFSRTNLYGKKIEQYLKGRSENVFIVAQIEHERAVANLDEILSVKGLDAIMVGPYDLSGSMNITGKFNDPKFNNAMETIFSKTKKHKIPMGVHVVQPDEASLKMKISEGYQFIAYGIDAVFLYSASENPMATKF